VPLAKSVWAREPAALSWLQQVKPHMFGHLPKGGAKSVDLAGTDNQPTTDKS
jgi:xanthosine utilization system XapX-like protein